ncbi:MAG: DUF951 domain-containing protein [Chloroflexi bacterium]|nr:DUF951 domain-containing protein [Chloroflexota bacterium]MBM3165841.1 DUF951 domain-containing protein [Chloroflexota bacterium]MBM3173604.1 DUF951 domain-containing protein [Chloroflexota bacterium]MBM4449297.1 DUF951 domain-containing protein [Chloroflexota bacterium]
MEIRIGDIVRLRKKHPCGGDQWQVLSFGVDVKIKCFTCQRLVLLDRGVFERRVKDAVLRGDASASPAAD